MFRQARGFLIGGTSGRTTLNGEGLQHEDGHSHIQSLTIPNCISYDPAYAYEVAVIMHDGLERMYGEKQENVYYYITTLNENYHMPGGRCNYSVCQRYRRLPVRAVHWLRLLHCGLSVRHSAPQPGRQPRLQMYAVR